MECSSDEATDFQETVWSHVRQIPPGKVSTYGNIAEALGKPGAAQAVGDLSEEPTSRKSCWPFLSKIVVWWGREPF